MRVCVCELSPKCIHGVHSSTTAPKSNASSTGSGSSKIRCGYFSPLISFTFWMTCFSPKSREKQLMPIPPSGKTMISQSRFAAVFVEILVLVAWTGRDGMMLFAVLVVAVALVGNFR